jgi:hypothetical protein
VLLRAIDAVGDWIGDHLTPRVQRRLGVLLIVGSLPLAAYGPFSGEQLLIYEMSAFAFTATGIATIVGAVPSEEN